MGKRHSYFEEGALREINQADDGIGKDSPAKCTEQDRKVDYNREGVKDGKGFLPCSEKFVDNFILRVLVADYLTENKKYVEVGAMNRTIRSLLDRSGLEKYKVKAIVFARLKESLSIKMLEKMPYRNEEKEILDTVYYYQEYKIACADLEYQKVLDFIRKQRVQ